jgi:hypothetical protein
MHIKCSPEVSRGDSPWYEVVEWVANRLEVRLRVANLAVLFDTLQLAGLSSTEQNQV